MMLLQGCHASTGIEARINGKISKDKWQNIQGYLPIGACLYKLPMLCVGNLRIFIKQKLPQKQGIFLTFAAK